MMHRETLVKLTSAMASYGATVTYRDATMPTARDLLIPREECEFEIVALWQKAPASLDRLAAKDIFIRAADALNADGLVANSFSRPGPRRSHQLVLAGAFPMPG